MALIAVTNIRHGNGEDGDVFIAAGEEVTGLPKDVIDNLREAGAVVEGSALKDAEALREQVRKLEAQIAELQSVSATAERLAGPFVEQTAADPQAGLPGHTNPEQEKPAPAKAAAKAATTKQDK